MSATKRSVEVLKRSLFYVVARAAIWCYGRVPVFGALRASVGIIRNQSRVLVIRRNDGRGLSFPGGLAFPWETDENTLVREIREETGLVSNRCEFVFRYESRKGIPARIAVFDVKATGQIRASWEGTPEWVEIVELQREVVQSQKHIVDRILGHSVPPHPDAGRAVSSEF